MTRRLRVLILLLLAALGAFAAEFPVSDVVLGDPPGPRTSFAMASDGDGFLAAWIDQRAYEPQLLAARVARNGQVLDPAAIRLGRGSAVRPQVLWNGQRYLVFQGSSALFVTEVSRDGTVSGPRTLLQNVNFDWARGASIATNGSRIVAVYGDTNGFLGNPDKVRVAVFTMDATLISETVIATADPANQYAFSRLDPSVAVNGSQFVVAWNVFVNEQLELKGVRLSSNGTAVDTQPRAIGTSGLETSLAANGSGYVAVSRFSSWGVSADLSSFTAPTELPLVTTDSAVVIQRGGRATLFGVQSGEEGAVLSAADFDDQGHSASPQAIAVTSQAALAAASNGNEIALLALAPGGGEEGTSAPVVSTIVSASTLQTLAAAAPLTKSATRQSKPSIAASDANTLVAWQESDGVYAGRLSATGARLDGRGILLGTSTREGDPSVVFDGQRYVVAFTHYKGDRDMEVVVRFVSPQGGLLPNEIRIPAADAGFAVSLAKGSEHVVLVWTDDLRLFAARINGAMQLIDTPVQVASGDPVSPAVAWSGTEYLIAWRIRRFDFDITSYPSVSGVRMSAGLTPLGPEQELLAAPDRDHMSVSLAWNGTSWLVASETQPAFVNGPIEVRVAVVGGSVSGTVAGNGWSPQLIAAGSRVWLAYKEGTAERSIRLVPLTAAGTVDSSVLQRFPAPTPVDSQSTERFSLASKGSQILLAYPRLAGAEAGHVPRVYTNSFTGQAAPGKRRSAKS